MRASCGKFAGACSSYRPCSASAGARSQKCSSASSEPRPPSSAALCTISVLSCVGLLHRATHSLRPTYIASANFLEQRLQRLRGSRIARVDGYNARVLYLCLFCALFMGAERKQRRKYVRPLGERPRLRLRRLLLRGGEVISYPPPQTGQFAPFLRLFG